MLLKSLLSLTAMTVTLLAFLPYIRAILRGQVRPHLFSWIIWGITTALVFFAQWHAGGGAGAVAIGVSAMLTLIIAVLAFIHRADTRITRLDGLFLLSALSSLPAWYVTRDPVVAVAILTLVDLLGFGPTLRKAYAAPWSESMLFFALFLLRNVLVILALENYNLATWLFPAAIATACAAVMAMLAWRRQRLANQTD